MVAARSDLQASLTWVAVDFLTYCWSLRKEWVKKAKGATVRRREEGKKHDKLRSTFGFTVLFLAIEGLSEKSTVKAWRVFC
ncbi:hypothetical protein [Saccharicrinis fermentans]|uniref:Uncharacterized protein n=1 Tax=Saccharicrinis fermentans DSM 9555 = JCM 21142 TaxID=869213 RepID=W7YQF2_9BACT|nr:hypothetical protein [Saccharicrinis fermentans]GAF04629.1 hypothetical protein JCM21142_93341 [Saccharicrinis fermentans DSM 9555 = JCM 21142]